jgi:multicomponent Na+:H+ antiporter subunit G
MSAADIVDVLRAALAGCLIGVGLILALGGAIGGLRFPDHFTRLHASAVNDPWGAIVIALGLAVTAPSWDVALRLLLLAVLAAAVGPLWSYFFGSAAYAGGLAPMTGRYQAPRPGRSSAS